MKIKRFKTALPSPLLLLLLFSQFVSKGLQLRAKQPSIISLWILGLGLAP